MSDPADVGHYLAVPSNSCLRDVDGERWISSVTIQVGRWHVAVRAGSAEIERCLREMLGPHLVDDPDAPAAFGIQETTPGLPTARPHVQVYEGCSPILTSRSVHRAVAFTTGLLERLLPRPDAEVGILRLAVHAIVSDDRAVLVPWRFPYRLPAAELQLARSGLRQLERSSVEIDPARGSVLVSPPRLLSHWDAGSLAGPEPQSPVTASGEREVVGWAFAGRREPLSRAQTLARGMRVIRAAPSRVAAFHSLAQVVERLDLVLVCCPEEMLSMATERLGHDVTASA